jgi:integrase
MSREATGTVDYVPAKAGEALGHYAARIRLNDGGRPRVHFSPAARSPNAEQRAREKAAEWSERARRENLSSADFGILARARPEPAAPRPEGDMGEWLRVWLASRRAKNLTATRENESHYKHHIAGATGGRHVRRWDADDLRRLSRELDAKVQGGEMKWKTAWNVWATATRMCKDACTSKLDELRVRADNPARDVAGPDRGAATAKQYLYPSEFARFVACERVPLRWRREVALAVYLYPRLGELRVLPWEDVDLEHGSIHIHRALDRESGKTKATKTKHPRRLNIEAALLPLLRAMRQESGGEGLVCSLPSMRDMARGLRRWLAHANVKRAELHESTPTRKAMTFHDLRATGITWMAIRGDDPLRIQQRAGHEDFATTQGYIREAESIREGFGEVFPPLPAALLKAPMSPSQTEKALASLAQASGPLARASEAQRFRIVGRGGRDSNPRPPA